MKWVEDEAREFRKKYPYLKGEDAYALAFVAQGLLLLNNTLGLQICHEKVVDWLAQTLEDNRANTVDKPLAALRAMIGAVESCSLDGRVYKRFDQLVAWPMDGKGCLDVNPSASIVIEAIKPFGGQGVAHEWAERGWIARDGKRLKVKRLKSAPDGPSRVWRLTEEGLAAAHSG